MSCWKCPKCGWGLDGGDETGVNIEPPYGVYEFNIPPLDQDRFFYCFHCGYKMPEPDTLAKLRDDIKSCNGDFEEWASRLTAIMERDAS